jgi:hypothetical protein
MSNTINQPLQDNVAKNCQEILLAQIRECFGRVAYSHKTHEKQADIFRGKDTFWKWVQIVLSVTASGSFLATFGDLFGCEKFWSLLGAILSALLATINLYFKNFNYGAEAKRHQDTAVQLWNIREYYLSLVADLTAESISIDEAKKIRDKLQMELSVIYKNAPRTTSEAYAEAQNALKFKEDLTFSSAEIDMLLPDKLRLQNKGEIR